MFDGSRGRDGITVFIGRFGFAQAYDQIVNQLRKMTCTFLIAKTEMVKLRSLPGSRQPILYQSGLAAGKDCGHALPARGF